MAGELTVERLQQRIRRALGWRRPQDWPQELDIVEVANEAGEWLVSVNEWKWLDRPVADLSIVADQGWVDLPADFGRIVGPVLLRGSTGYCEVTFGDIDDVATQLSSQPEGPRQFVGTIVHPTPALNGPRPTPRLEIAPAPTETLANALKLPYRAGWYHVTEGSDHVLVPSWLTSLYIEVAVAHVAGREQEAKGTLFDRLDRILLSSMFESAKARDAAIQPYLGEMQGTVGEMFLGSDIPPGLRRVPTIMGGSANP